MGGGGGGGKCQFAVSLFDHDIIQHFKVDGSCTKFTSAELIAALQEGLLVTHDPFHADCSTYHQRQRCCRALGGAGPGLGGAAQFYSCFLHQINRNL